MELTQMLYDPLFWALVGGGLFGFYFKGEIRDKVTRFDSFIVFGSAYFAMMTVYLISRKRE